MYKKIENTNLKTSTLIKSLYLSILFTLLLSPIISTAQSFAPIGSKWHYSKFQDGVPPSIFTSYVKLESVKDTTIIGTSCKLIIGSDSLYMYKDNSEKVFYYDNDSLRFCLLYDFSVMAGDSFELDCIADPTNSSKNLIVYVDSISQININGTIKKMQYYRTDDNLPGFRFFGWVIEDIGNYTFMFPTVQNGLIGPLRCYEDDSLGLYTTNFALPCDYITNIEDIKGELKNIYVYPTLVEDKINIINEMNKKINLTITSILGKQELISYNLIDNEIDLSDIPLGIYFVTIFNEDNQFTTKIIKK
jgi:hypothetical protein